MPFDYVIYLMLFIGFLYGLRNGIKHEIKDLISYTVSFVLVFLFIGPLLLKIEALVNIIEMAKEYCKVVFDFMKINTFFIDFVAFYIIPFLLIRLILDGFIKLLFFNKNKHLMEKKGFFKRLSGGVLGLVIGVQLSIFMLVVLNSFMKLNLEGTLTQIIIKYFPDIKSIIDVSACLLG